MPVAMDWETPERKVIVVTFMGQWDVNDLHRMFTKRNSMMECVRHPVHQILDMTHSTSSPSNLLSIMNRIELPSDKKDSLVFVVKASDYIKSLGRIMKTIAPPMFENIHAVDSLDEAKAMIENQHHTVRF